MSLPQSVYDYCCAHLRHLDQFTLDHQRDGHDKLRCQACAALRECIGVFRDIKNKIDNKTFTSLKGE